MPVQINDPYLAQSFLVEIDGVTVAGFSEVSGLSVEISPVEYRNGSEDTTVRKIPGLAKYANITLKRGVVGDLTLWQWLNAVRHGEVQRRDGVIVLLDARREPVLRIRFRRGWVCKWEGPTLNAQSNEVAMESIEICHEGLEIE
jgi:phage tail-like protein